MSTTKLPTNPCTRSISEYAMMVMFVVSRIHHARVRMQAEQSMVGKVL
jgi:hypothetical protein